MLNLKSLRAAGMTALALAACAGTAHAADMLAAPPPPPMVPAASAIAADSGFYLRGDIGVGLYDHSTIDTVPAVAGLSTIHSSVNGAFFGGVGVGYQLNSWLRGDITGEYRFNTGHRHVDQWVGGGNVITGKIGGFVGLANGYVDLGTWNRITPFIGAGVGVASMTMGKTTDVGLGAGAGTVATGPGKTNTGLAWALHAGLGYDLGGNWKAEVAYRYLNMGTMSGGNVVCPGGPPVCPYHVRLKDLSSHDVKFGLRYMFADAAPILAPGPLVRKY